jgi:hypothetical protein
VCCSNGGYCNPGRICATYQDQAVCCLTAQCTELEQWDGSTYTIPDGTATPMGTGAVTTVPTGAGVSLMSSSSLGGLSLPTNSTAPTSQPYTNTSTASAGPGTPVLPPLPSSETSGIYTIETINPSSSPPQSGPTSTTNPGSAPPASPQPTGPSIVIVTTQLQPTVVASQSLETPGTLTTIQGASPTSTTTPPGFTGAACRRLESPGWVIGAVAALYLA